MRFIPRFIVIFAFSVILFAACNPNKNKWLNRNWHTMTGRFNVYFNGEIKFDEVLESLEQTHQDDFTKILSVFPIGDEAASKGVSGQLDIVLKKTSLAIQNHYVGRYTDNSYYLMGRAHYFKRDYYAAMEAFQYVNSKYKDQGLRPVSTAWIAKCYVGLNKVEEAEAVMGLLLSEEQSKQKKASLYRKYFPETPREYTHEIYATAADIAIKQRKFVMATVHLKKALDVAPKKKQRIRYTYILGQLYTEMDSVEEAGKYYTKVLKMLAPYEFEFNAGINLSRSYNAGDQKAVKRIRRSLKRMLRDDKNEGHYDQIWYALGDLEMKEKRLEPAIFDYKKSAEVGGKNANQKALAYLALGNIYLAIPDYRLAQAYYDSTAGSLSPDYKDYKKVMNKKNVLSELIQNLIVIETEDSLQELSKLSSQELDLKIDGWITQAKKDSAENAKRSKDRKEKEKEDKLKGNQQPIVANTNTKGFGQQGSWYFYNPAIMVSGASEFFSQKKWGQRVNEDYWRVAAMEKPTQEEAKDAKDGKEATKDAEGESADTSEATKREASTGSVTVSGSRKDWIANVPFTKEALRRSNQLMTEAYYNIGGIYHEKLEDSKQAAKDYELLLYRFPGSSYEPEVLYKLFKIYTEQGNAEQAKIKKDRLLTEYPTSPFALILQNKSIQNTETTANKEVSEAYERLYAFYNEGRYDEVKQGKLEADRKFAGNGIQAKFDLLYALALGKTASEDVFKTELTDLSKRYPKTDVAERASLILDYLKRRQQEALPDSLKPKVAEFVIEEAAPYYTIIAIKDDKLDINELVARTLSYNEEFHQFDNLRVNPMLSNEGYQLIMIREFKEFNKAFTFYNDFESRKAVSNTLKYPGNYFVFVISQANFKKILKEQKVDLYKTYFSDYVKSKNTKQ